MPLPFLLLADGRFPTGGYAHSGGLEAAVGAGLRTEGVPSFIAGRLDGIARAEASLAVLSARAARRADLDLLLELDLEFEARCPSPPLRDAARRLGAQLLRTAAVVWPASAVLSLYRQSSSRTPRPVAFGVVASAAALDDLQLAEAYIYDDAAIVAAAAVRLLAVDSATTSRWLVELSPLVARLARQASSPATDDPRRLPAGFAPANDLLSMAHARRNGKLFAS
jgi:urease accessory protein